MPAADAERAIRLDRHLDALLRDTEPPDDHPDADLATTLLHLHTLSSRPLPDPAFVQSLNEALVGGAIDQIRPEVASANRVIRRRVILRNEGSRHIVNNVSHEPRFFASAQNDTLVEKRSGAVSSPNGHTQPAPALADHAALPRTMRPWWQRLEIAAAVLIVAVLGAYLTIANLGRAVPPLSRLSAITAQTDGTAPVELRIGAIGIDAPIEAVQAFPDDMVTPWAGDIWATGWQDGGPVLIPEPSDPWNVAWLENSAAPGEGGNVVLYGHLEYWDTTHAVFWDLTELISGDRFEITGENDAVFTYEVEWSRRFPIDVDEDQQREILGPTGQESLTLITNAGAYDEKVGTYPEVLVVRAVRATSAPDPSRGTMPVRLRVGALGLNALIEPREAPPATSLIPEGDSLVAADILDDEWILIPPGSDPTIVAWREESAALGAGSNVVLEGGSDQAGIQPAVFASLAELKPGDEIEVFGLDKIVYWYEVDWVQRFPADVDPRQRLDILGPTPSESLTLITNAGEADRESGLSREVLVVRAYLLTSLPLLVEAMPDPSACLTAPQSVDALEAASTLIAKPGHAPTPTPLTDLEGEPADAKTIEAVIKAEQELVACLNANDPLRTYALYTGDGLLRLMRYIGGPMDALYEWTPDFSGLATPAPPRPATDWHALLAVEDVRVLPDGRVAALVTIGPQGTGMAGVPTGVPVVYIFQPGERYLIDEFMVPSLATPAP